MARSNKFNRDEDDADKAGAIPSVYMLNGFPVIPAGHEEYYAQTWKWKQLMGLPIEPFKVRYLQEYERQHGAITTRRKINGDVVDMPIAIS